MVDLGGLISLRADLITNIFTGTLPTDLLDFDLDCDNGTCIPAGFGIDYTFDLFNGSFPKTLPKIEFDGVEFGLPDGIVDLMDGLLNKTEEFLDSFDVLLDAGVECEAYTTLPVNPAAKAREVFNLNVTELGVPDCDLNIRICSQIKLNGIGAFQSTIRELFSGILQISGRRLGVVDDLWSAFDNATCAPNSKLGKGWGIALPIGKTPFKLLTAMLQKLVPLRSLERSYSRFSGASKYPEAAFWNVYWRQQLMLSPFGSFIKILDINSKIIFGCEEPEIDGEPGKFNVKFWSGPFFEVSFSTLPLPQPFSWKPTKHFSGAVDMNVEADKQRFNSETKELVAFDFKEFECYLDFIESTWYVIFQDREAAGPNSLGEKDFKDFEKTLETFIVGTKDTFSELDKRASEARYSQRTYDADYKATKKYIRNKALPKAIKMRSLFQAAYDSGRESDQYESKYFFRLMSGIDTDCAGPKVTSTTGLTFKQKLSDGGEKIFNLGKFFLENTGFHPKVYGNLFGAGVDISLVRSAITGQQERSDTEIKLPLVGPFPGSYFSANGSPNPWENFKQVLNDSGLVEDPATDWVRVFADTNPFSAFLHFYAVAKSQWYSKHPNLEAYNDVRTAIDNINVDKMDRVIATKYGVRFTFSFGEWIINAREHEPDSVDEFTRSYRETSIGLGFQGT
jgi:hypothetical protein